MDHLARGTPTGEQETREAFPRAWIRDRYDESASSRRFRTAHGHSIDHRGPGVLIEEHDIGGEWRPDGANRVQRLPSEASGTGDEERHRRA
jgi:hypothetical protein